MRWAAMALVPFLTSCFVGDEFNWASREDLIASAARCGITDFVPTKLGDNWAASVPDTIPNHAAKEDCIYADLKRQDLLATR